MSGPGQSGGSLSHRLKVGSECGGGAGGETDFIKKRKELPLQYVQFGGVVKPRSCAVLEATPGWREGQWGSCED